MSDEHSSPIKNWKQLLVVVFLAFLVPIILIIIITQLVTGHLKGPSSKDAGVLNRIKPVGEVVLAAASEPANAPSAATANAATSAAMPSSPTIIAATSAVPGKAAGASAPAAAAAAAKPDGKKVYDTVCMACHATGVAGAPKFGDKLAWAPRIKTGIEALHNSALKGKGAMPPKGGNTALSDAEVKAAVDYVVSAAK